MTKLPHTKAHNLSLLAAALACLLSAAAGAAPPRGVRPAEKTAQAGAGAAQGAAPAPLLKRTTTRRELRAFGHGGTLTIYGAPEGSVTVEGWPRSQVEIVAEVELQGETEEDLAVLAEVNGFHLDEDFNHFRVLTLGTHDSGYLKRAGRKLPKRLLGLPWRIDYRVRVPVVTDLYVYAGRGPLSLAGVDGAVRLQAGAGGATFDLAGGDFEGTLAGGPVTVRVPARSWRGRGMTLRLAGGDLTVELPSGYSGDLDATILRAGRVENHHPGLAPRAGEAPTERSLRARAGAGGAPLNFTVVDGTVKVVQAPGARRPAGGKP